MLDYVVGAGRVVGMLAVILLAAWVSRLAARRVGQPAVVGEITLGLVVGPVLVAGPGQSIKDVLIPAGTQHVLGLLGQAGLVLFLLGVVHELRVAPARLPRRAVALSTAGSLVLPLLAGGALAWWVLGTHLQALRGGAPTPAFVLLLAVSMSVTAVPVLARILDDRGLTGTPVGRLALNSAVIIDAVCWLLFGVVIALSAGYWGGAIRELIVLVAGLSAAYLLRRLLRTGPAVGKARAWPWPVTVMLAAVVLAAASATQAWGLTTIFGTFVVGMAVPTGQAAAPWSAVVRRAAGVGHTLVPCFFVVTGLGLTTGSLSGLTWTALVVPVVVTVSLAATGKLAGGYVGARLGRQEPVTAARVGVLMNTRGLTEIILLQAANHAGVLSSALFLILMIMALVTTALTGPLLAAIDRHVRRHGRTDELGGYAAAQRRLAAHVLALQQGRAERRKGVQDGVEVAVRADQPARAQHGDVLAGGRGNGQPPAKLTGGAAVDEGL